MSKTRILLSPFGVPINGVLELTPGKAGIVPVLEGEDPRTVEHVLGGIPYRYEGGTEHFYDDQRPKRIGDEIVLLDDDGEECVASKCTIAMQCDSCGAIDEECECEQDEDADAAPSDGVPTMERLVGVVRELLDNRSVDYLCREDREMLKTALLPAEQELGTITS